MCLDKQKSAVTMPRIAAAAAAAGKARAAVNGRISFRE